MKSEYLIIVGFFAIYANTAWRYAQRLTTGYSTRSFQTKRLGLSLIAIGSVFIGLMLLGIIPVISDRNPVGEFFFWFCTQGFAAILTARIIFGVRHAMKIAATKAKPNTSR